MSIPSLKANDDDNKREAFHQLMSKIIERFQKSYNLHACSIGSGNAKGVKQIALGFFKYSPMTKDECRIVMMSCLNDFDEIVNSDENAKKYKLAYPNALNHLSMSIIVVNEDGSEILHPEAEGVSFVNGKLYFRTQDPENPFKPKEKICETYEEAKAIVLGNGEGFGNS